ncbi:hypothetical protein SLS60_012106 [Paraconiothyrium brasiliense]|uniref:Uncharacterized protein n=1 Tax=Paraconiothyrium brasiliense TaxID=300254 RepID=A0ABR3QGQ8_9PLEO
MQTGPSGSEYDTATESTPATTVQEEHPSDITRIQAHNLSIKQAIYLSFIANARIRWALKEEGTTTKEPIDGLDNVFQKDKTPLALPNLELHLHLMQKMEKVEKDHRTESGISPWTLLYIASYEVIDIVKPKSCPQDLFCNLGSDHNPKIHDYGAHDYSTHDYSAHDSAELQPAWGYKLNMFSAIDMSLKRLKCEVVDVSRALTELASLNLPSRMNRVALQGPIRSHEDELFYKLRMLSETIEAIESYRASLVKIETEWAGYKKAYNEAFEKLE